MNLPVTDGPYLDAEGVDPDFTDFVRRWQGLVDAVAYTKLEDRDRAEDAAQQTWLQVGKAWDRGERPRHPEAWLLTILRNVIASGFRRRPPLPRLMVEPPAPSVRSPLEQHEEDELVRRVLGEIEPDERELLLLRYVEELKTKELCRKYGVSKSALYDRLRAAREKFVRIFRPRE